MNERSAQSLDALRNALASDSRVTLLQEREQAMLSNEEVQALIRRKNEAEEKYEDALSHYGSKSEITIEARKQLHEAKLSLDENPCVKSYTEAYLVVRDLYAKIDEILFARFKERKPCEHD